MAEMKRIVRTRRTFPQPQEEEEQVTISITDVPEPATDVLETSEAEATVNVPQEDLEPVVEVSEVVTEPIRKQTRSTIRKKGDPPPERVLQAQNLNPTLSGEFQKLLETANLQSILDLLSNGQSITIYKVADTVYRMAVDQEPLKLPQDIDVALSGVEYNQEVCTQAYLVWIEEWQQLSTEEKYERAVQAGVSWKVADNPRIDVMRAGNAVRKKLGIVKYKPEYGSLSARNAVRGK